MGHHQAGTKAGKQVAQITDQYAEGLITRGEKYNKVVDIWAKATTDVANEMMEEMKTAPPTDEGDQPVLDKRGFRIKGQQGSDATAGRDARSDGQTLW